MPVSLSAEVCLGREAAGRELCLVGDPVGTCFSGVCGCVIFFQVDEVFKFNFKNLFLALLYNRQK